MRLTTVFIHLSIPHRCLSWMDNMDHIYLKELRHSIFLSHLGDLNVGCFTPSKDVVIPPMSTNLHVYNYGSVSLDRSLQPLVFTVHRLGGGNWTNAKRDQSQRTTFAYFRGTITWAHSNSYPSLGVKKGPSESYSNGVCDC